MPECNGWYLEHKHVFHGAGVFPSFELAFVIWMLNYLILDKYYFHLISTLKTNNIIFFFLSNPLKTKHKGSDLVVERDV
jgi:hypothetical protein